METVLGRYKNLIVLAVVLFAQILGLAVQVRRTTDAESSSLIRVWAVGAITPFEKILVWVQTSTGNVWHNYFYLRGVRAENRELKQEIERMRIEQVRISQDADQARRLQALLAFKEQFISQTMAAQVIGSSGTEQSRSVYIDKGENHGIKPDMAVITGDGVVGKVLRVFPSTSLVLLIDDQSSGVGAILEKSRLQGILRGTPAGEVILDKVMSDEAVPVGERILTSGGDRVFPKGLPIGIVTQVKSGSDNFLSIRVKAIANLGKLEEVLVVTKIDERQATPEQTVPLRAADILAERLPSVPPKPAEPAPGTASSGTHAVTKPTGESSGSNSNAAAGTTPKPKSVTPAATTQINPGAPKPAVKATINGDSTGPTAPVTSQPKPAKPAAEPPSQPPPQDTPQ